jgi:hypothetical protein
MIRGTKVMLNKDISPITRYFKPDDKDILETKIAIKEPIILNLCKTIHKKAPSKIKTPY